MPRLIPKDRYAVNIGPYKSERYAQQIAHMLREQGFKRVVVTHDWKWEEKK